jgi:CI-like repressor metal proteinase motif protein
MIRGLLENENLDDFDYVRFMERYNLKTIANETMVIDEYRSLID